LPVFPPPATPAYCAALNIIIADVGSMGKRREPGREGVRMPREATEQAVTKPALAPRSQKSAAVRRDRRFVR
jgi:hypothetical protein